VSWERRATLTRRFLPLYSTPRLSSHHSVGDRFADVAHRCCNNRVDDNDVLNTIFTYESSLLLSANVTCNVSGILHGPSHMEVMSCVRQDEIGDRVFRPCLVEVGARCHGVILCYAIKLLGYAFNCCLPFIHSFIHSFKFCGVGRGVMGSGSH